MKSELEQAFWQTIGQMSPYYQWSISELAQELHLPRNTVRYQMINNMDSVLMDEGPIPYWLVSNRDLAIWASEHLSAIYARQERKRNAQTS